MRIEIESNIIGRQLEALVDANGLPAVLDALAEICAAKAEHIEHSWQDRGLARLWTAAGRMVERAAEGVRKRFPD